MIVVKVDPAADGDLGDFLEEAGRWIRAGRGPVVLQFVREVELEPDDLQALHQVLKEGRARWVDLRMVVPTEKMRQTLLLMRLHFYARLYGSLEDAVHGKETSAPWIRRGILAACGLFLLFYFHTIRWLFFSWRVDPYYSHGPLVLAAALFLLWKRRGDLRLLKPRFSSKTVFFEGLACLLYLAGFLWSANFLTALSLVPFLLGAVLLFCGRGAYGQVFLPVMLLLFAVPLPRLDEAASVLQHWTAGWAAAIVSRLGVAAYSAGVNIFFGDVRVVIDAPCSGLRSLIALLFIGALWIGFLEGPRKKRILLFASLVPISVLSNLFRIVLLVLIAAGLGLRTAMLYFHYVSGLLLFVLALSVLFWESKWMGCGAKPVSF